MVGTGRFELPTCRLGGGRSIHLSYVPTSLYCRMPERLNSGVLEAKGKAIASHHDSVHRFHRMARSFRLPLFCAQPCTMRQDFKMSEFEATQCLR